MTATPPRAVANGTTTGESEPSTRTVKRSFSNTTTSPSLRLAVRSVDVVMAVAPAAALPQAAHSCVQSLAVMLAGRKKGVPNTTWSERPSSAQPSRRSR